MPSSSSLNSAAQPSRHQIVESLSDKLRPGCYLKVKMRPNYPCPGFPLIAAPQQFSDRLRRIAPLLLAIITSEPALASDAITTGVPVLWGNQVLPYVEPGTRFKSVSAGAEHNLALLPDGSVIAWGANEFGQAQVPTGLSNSVAVAAGGFHSLALRHDGTVVSWGDRIQARNTVPRDLADVVSIAAGGWHSLALTCEGQVTAWGYNWAGQATVPADLGKVVAIAAGGDHSLALRADGTVVAWGWNDYGQTSIPDGLTNVISIAAGGRANLAIVRVR